MIKQKPLKHLNVLETLAEPLYIYDIYFLRKPTLVGFPKKQISYLAYGKTLRQKQEKINNIPIAKKKDMEHSFSKIVKSIGRLEEHDPKLRHQLANYCYDIVGCCQEVHRDMGPFLNEYMYQDALDICFSEHGITDNNKIKEYYFTAQFHGYEIKHPHKVDFFIRKKVFVECKAIEAIGTEQRQQLWNYMRLAKVRIGILYNFAPIIDQCERYYLDIDSHKIYTF